jgi:5-methylcytosine-specific restriction endonuclease McrA
VSAQPVTTTGIRKRLPAIKAWLSAAGAEVLESTNEWELLRFRADGQTCVVYTNKRDRLTMDTLTTRALTAYFNGTPWKAHVKVRPKRTSVDELTIRKRDGDDCFYCCEVVAIGEGTIEHLVAVSHKGPNHISNKFLAHGPCNSRAGNQSAPQKIAIHVKAKMEKYRRELESKLRPRPATDTESHLPLAGVREAGAAGHVGVPAALVQAASHPAPADLANVPARTGDGHAAQ